MLQLEPLHVREEESTSSLTVLHILIIGHQPTNNKTCRGGPLTFVNYRMKRSLGGFCKVLLGSALQCTCRSPVCQQNLLKTLGEK